ncbi:MAG: hypothetical protein ACRDJU_09360 [Actinomycetota bacterium]
MWLWRAEGDIWMLEARLARVQWIAGQVARPGMRVAGAVAPRLHPAWLDDAGAILTKVSGPNQATRLDSLMQVTLCQGRADASAGPFLTVITNLAPTVPDTLLTSLLTSASRAHRRLSLHDLIGQERSRLFREAGIDEWRMTSSPVEGQSQLRLADDAVPVRLVRQDNVWACAVPATGTDAGDLPFLEIVGRGVDPSEVHLGWLEDVHPFAEERIRGFRDFMDRATEPLALPVVPAGAAVYRAFVEACLRGTRSSGAVIIGTNPNPAPSGTAAEYQALQQGAIDLLTETWGRNDAHGRIASIADHVGELSVFCGWFDADPRRREMAIKDILTYGTEGQPVSSQAAQLAWEAVREARPQLSPPLPPEQRDLSFERDRDHDLGNGAERGRWKWEWDAWAQAVLEGPPEG